MLFLEKKLGFFPVKTEVSSLLKYLHLRNKVVLANKQGCGISFIPSAHNLLNPYKLLKRPGAQR